MRELRALFRKGLPPLIEELEKVTSELRLGETDVADEARRLAHQLKGFGGSFGYPKVTKAARDALRSNPQEMVGALDTLLATMRHIVSDEGPAAAQILVIDDDPLIQQLLLSTLQGHSREVILASSLLGAEPLLGSDLSLIILDLFLPDGDGRHVIKQIRSAPETELTPILVLSGASSRLAESECLELGIECSQAVEGLALHIALPARLQGHFGSRPPATTCRRDHGGRDDQSCDAIGSHPVDIETNSGILKGRTKAKVGGIRPLRRAAVRGARPQSQ
ncbi:MAG: response regulator [Actinomycetota bacterium]|nr:response regulator [Actinomycetota bacterium]